MAVKVLIVDDSGFFRRRLSEILQPMTDIEVVGAATNGREAIDLASRLKPDVITMDYEMPVMDGISAVKEIMRTNPTPVIMFSSLTYEGARVTFDALEAGAVDFLPKSFEAMSGDASRIKALLHDRIMAVSGSRRGAAASKASAPVQPVARPAKPSVTPVKPSPISRTPSPAAPLKKDTPSAPAKQEIKRPPSRKGQKVNASVVLIGTSTGGPVALQKILTQLPANFPKPLVLVQHMPATFTPAFAERLNRLSAIGVKQVENGEVLKPGVAYIAPGGKQTLIERSGGSARVKILDGDERLHYKPCVDVTFGSAAKTFPGKVLGIILTGMGADGREGCRMLRDSGATIWAQDEESSVIYGMPMAVATAGLADDILSLDEFAARMVESVS
ncbi:chemotaxis response regulator protein-glutamate methylesterase [Hahella sp. CCB-MM4]|uniref:protein-glutamate methylesterase/protein-glutamine glutaminase n=1 Tax=Hahella sp. (strain CCB-MM4) TaxID=1926491 RepID=UPI000B9B5402|nr:chemotaxis response regulator protein-glutamate methylesterase [Hahella sp. CCB-MM4]OZG72868.1 chemotaxis response regulator protein-glutamate methylesterase [Hahella sp. CCB-MM4]